MCLQLFFKLGKFAEGDLFFLIEDLLDALDFV